ncbi:MAG: GNAT family N-acetyltransferase [Pyrinomonadaceae bacterium]
MNDFYPRGVDTIWKITERKTGLYLGRGQHPPQTRTAKGLGDRLLPDPRSVGKGLATEVARRLVRYSFETLNLPEVFTTVDRLSSWRNVF